MESCLLSAAKKESYSVRGHTLKDLRKMSISELAVLRDSSDHQHTEPLYFVIFQTIINDKRLAALEMFPVHPQRPK